MGSLIFLAFYGIYFDFLVVNCCRGHLFFIAVTKGVAYLGGVADFVLPSEAYFLTF